MTKLSVEETTFVIIVTRVRYSPNNVLQAHRVFVFKNFDTPTDFYFVVELKMKRWKFATFLKLIEEQSSTEQITRCHKLI